MHDPPAVANFRYGFGVGGEYPMAASSAAERSATTPELRHLRAQQVILVFSNQVRGMPPQSLSLPTVPLVRFEVVTSFLTGLLLPVVPVHRAWVT